jgi:hypothetical protein
VASNWATAETLDPVTRATIDVRLDIHKTSLPCTIVATVVYVGPEQAYRYLAAGRGSESYRKRRCMARDKSRERIVTV